ncbi:MAG: cobalamin-dependent protein, partial [Candidatus Omnitrophota bacterium]|nr:cobalamin-dependent protein [Candidatus Omnitrophota bacterium]
MKIAVVKPPSNARRIYPALGLGYVAAALKQDNHDVEYVDACLIDFPIDSLDGKKRVGSPINWEVIERHLADKCKDADIAIIGGSFTADINNSFKIVNIFKRINKECKTALGGTHSCALTKQVMEECDNVDFVVRGEGEYIARLLAKIISGKGDIRGIKGISYRDTGGRICVSEKSD